MAQQHFQDKNGWQGRNCVIRESEGSSPNIVTGGRIVAAMGPLGAGGVHWLFTSSRSRG